MLFDLGPVFSRKPFDRWYHGWDKNNRIYTKVLKFDPNKAIVTLSNWIKFLFLPSSPHPDIATGFNNNKKENFWWDFVLQNAMKSTRMIMLEIVRGVSRISKSSKTKKTVSPIINNLRKCIFVPVNFAGHEEGKY